MKPPKRKREPLGQRSKKCGCEIAYTNGSSGEDYHIEYCAMHSLAGEMLEALKYALATFDPRIKSNSPCVDKLKDLLRRAEGGNEK